MLFRKMQPDSMTRLKDLSARELADLLALPLDRAGAWLEVAASVQEESYHVRWLSDLTESSPVV